jgi:hypothetical protein
MPDSQLPVLVVGAFYYYASYSMLKETKIPVDIWWWL